MVVDEGEGGGGDEGVRGKGVGREGVMGVWVMRWVMRCGGEGGERRVRVVMGAGDRGGGWVV